MRAVCFGQRMSHIFMNMQTADLGGPIVHTFPLDPLIIWLYILIVTSKIDCIQFKTLKIWAYICIVVNAQLDVGSSGGGLCAI